MAPKPRRSICGNTLRARRSARYGWPRNDVTWYFRGNLRRIQIEDTVQLIDRAAATWSRVCGLRMSMWMPSSVYEPDIVIDSVRIDGQGDVLADMEVPEWSTPEQIRMRLDITERFVIDDAAVWPSVSLRHIVEHELGHGIGIDHGGKGRMEQWYNQTPELDQWSIDQAVAIYGPPEQPPTPPPTGGVEDIVLYQTPCGGHVIRLVRSTT